MKINIKPARNPCRPSSRSVSDEAAIDRWTSEGGAAGGGRKSALVAEVSDSGRKTFNASQPIAQALSQRGQARIVSHL